MEIITTVTLHTGSNSQKAAFAQGMEILFLHSSETTNPLRMTSLT